MDIKFNYPAAGAIVSLEQGKVSLVFPSLMTAQGAIRVGLEFEAAKLLHQELGRIIGDNSSLANPPMKH
jgi:hypothetical protein